MLIASSPSLTYKCKRHKHIAILPHDKGACQNKIANERVLTTSVKEAACLGGSTKELEGEEEAAVAEEEGLLGAASTAVGFLPC